MPFNNVLLLLRPRNCRIKRTRSKILFGSCHQSSGGTHHPREALETHTVE